MKSVRRAAVVDRIGVSSAIVIALALSLPGCNDCDPVERLVATSPDNAFSATELLYDCGGATVAASTSVVVRPATWAKQPYSEMDVLVLRGDESTTIEWTGPRALTLTVAAEARVEFHRPTLEGLAITLERRR